MVFCRGVRVNKRGARNGHVGGSTGTYVVRLPDFEDVGIRDVGVPNVLGNGHVAVCRVELVLGQPDRDLNLVVVDFGEPG